MDETFDFFFDQKAIKTVQKSEKNGINCEKTVKIV